MTFEASLDFIQSKFKIKEEKPLIVAIQGCQGSGKSYLAAKLKAALGDLDIKTAVLSLDDLYLPHSDLLSLHARDPTNKLLDGRGLPGTHDVELGSRMLGQLAEINTSKQPVHLPVYDKSLFNGQGDRSSQTLAVEAPLDVVIFEGWMVAFTAIDADVLSQAYADQCVPNTAAVMQHSFPGGSHPTGPFFIHHKLHHLQAINAALSNYQNHLWSAVDCLIRLLPKDMSFIFGWRMQQEHDMMARNGNSGMSDQEVIAFVERYMPLYEIARPPDFDDKSRMLQLTLDQDRQLTSG